MTTLPRSNNIAPGYNKPDLPRDACIFI